MGKWQRNMFLERTIKAEQRCRDFSAVGVAPAQNGKGRGRKPNHTRVNCPLTAPRRSHGVGTPQTLLACSTDEHGRFYKPFAEDIPSFFF